MANFRESSRLEGITIPETLTTPLENPKEIEQARPAIINRYK